MHFIDSKEGWGCMEEEENSHNGKQKTNLTGKARNIYQSTLFQSLPLREVITKTQAGTKKLLGGPLLGLSEAII